MGSVLDGALGGRCLCVTFCVTSLSNAHVWVCEREQENTNEHTRLGSIVRIWYLGSGRCRFFCMQSVCSGQTSPTLFCEGGREKLKEAWLLGCLGTLPEPCDVVRDLITVSRIQLQIA